MTEQIISQSTGFDRGETFENEAQVREYFTVESMRSMLSGNCDFTQDELTAMAETVIENGWHMDDDEPYHPSRYCTCNQCWDGDYDYRNER